MSYWIWGGLTQMTSVLQEGKLDTNRKREDTEEKVHVKLKAEAGMRQLQAKQCQVLPLTTRC